MAKSESVSFKEDLAEASIRSRTKDWDSSTLYKVDNFIRYSESEKIQMFKHLCNDLVYTNQETMSLINKINQLEQQIMNYEKNFIVKDDKSKWQS